MKGDFFMYENENRNLNENTNPEGNMPETTVNWTTPKPEDSRNQGNMETAASRDMIPYIPSRP